MGNLTPGSATSEKLPLKHYCLPYDVQSEELQLRASLFDEFQSSFTASDAVLSVKVSLLEFILKYVCCLIGSSFLKKKYSFTTEESSVIVTTLYGFIVDHYVPSHFKVLASQIIKKILK